MSQLHFYVPDDIERGIKEKAARANMPLSRYLAEIIKREIRTPEEWPDGYFEQVFGQWEGEPLERPSQGHYEERPPFK